MKKKSLKKKLDLKKHVISKLNAAKTKGGITRYCWDTDNCGPTMATMNCQPTGTGTVNNCGPNSIGCPIT